MLVRRPAAVALLGALGWLVAACGSSSPTPPATQLGAAGSAPPAAQDSAMTDTRASIYPADQLLAWLDQHASDPSTLDEVPLRLPVVVVLTDNRMDVATATVGDASDALAIAVDDRTLGVPIAGKLPMFFGEGASTGMLWLRGLWRGGPKKSFQVTRVEAAITAAERASAITVEIAE